MSSTVQNCFPTCHKLIPPTALKIHISLETKILLDINGSFVTEHRGAIEIKVGFKIYSLAVITK